MARAKTVVTPRRNLNTFKAAHDQSTVINNKIRAALERLRREHGDEAYAYENANPPDDNSEILPFTKLADVSAAHLNQFRAGFLDHVVEVKQDLGSHRAPRKVWFATVKAATKARGGKAEKPAPKA